MQIFKKAETGGRDRERYDNEIEKDYDDLRWLRGLKDVVGKIFETKGNSNLCLWWFTLLRFRSLTPFFNGCAEIRLAKEVI